MDHYETTKFLKPYADKYQDEIKQRVAESTTSEDEVELIANTLKDLLANDPEVQAEMVDAFWSSIDWRLLADMHLGLDWGSSV